MAQCAVKGGDRITPHPSTENLEARMLSYGHHRAAVAEEYDATTNAGIETPAPVLGILRPIGCRLDSRSGLHRWTRDTSIETTAPTLRVWDSIGCALCGTTSAGGRLGSSRTVEGQGGCQCRNSMCGRGNHQSTWG